MDEFQVELRDVCEHPEKMTKFGSLRSGAALYRRLAGQKMPFMYRTVAHPDGSRSLAGGGLGQVQILIKRGWDEKDSLYEARCNELVVAATLHNPRLPALIAASELGHVYTLALEEAWGDMHHSRLRDRVAVAAAQAEAEKAAGGLQKGATGAKRSRPGEAPEDPQPPGHLGYAAGVSTGAAGHSGQKAAPAGPMDDQYMEEANPEYNLGRKSAQTTKQAAGAGGVSSRNRSVKRRKASQGPRLDPSAAVTAAAARIGGEQGGRSVQTAVKLSTVSKPVLQVPPAVNALPAAAQYQLPVPSPQRQVANEGSKGPAAAAGIVNDPDGVEGGSVPGVQPARNPTEWQRLSTVCWMINSTQDGALRAQLVRDNAALLHRFTQSLLQGAPAGATLEGVLAGLIAASVIASVLHPNTTGGTAGTAAGQGDDGSGGSGYGGGGGGGSGSAAAAGGSGGSGGGGSGGSGTAANGGGSSNGAGGGGSGVSGSAANGSGSVANASGSDGSAGAPNGANPGGSSAGGGSGRTEGAAAGAENAFVTPTKAPTDAQGQAQLAPYSVLSAPPPPTAQMTPLFGQATWWGSHSPFPQPQLNQGGGNAPGAGPQAPVATMASGDVDMAGSPDGVAAGAAQHP